MRIVVILAFAVTIVLGASFAKAEGQTDSSFAFLLSTKDMPSYLSSTQFRAAAETAAAFWNNIPGASAVTPIGSTTTEGCLVNARVICWLTNIQAVCFAGSTGTITTEAAGCQSPWVSSTGQVYPKIGLNAQMSQANSVSLVCLLKVEMGRALGLIDPRVPSNVPPSLKGCYDSPQPGDVSALRARYPEIITDMSPSGALHISCVRYGPAYYSGSLQLGQTAGVAEFAILNPLFLGFTPPAGVPCRAFNGNQLIVNVRKPGFVTSEYDLTLSRKPNGAQYFLINSERLVQ